MPSLLSATKCIELNSNQIEDAKYKNNLCCGTEERILIADQSLTNATEIVEILKGNEFLLDYDLVLFGENVPEGEASLTDLLVCCNMHIFGYTFKRKCMEYVGCFNEELVLGTDYEFLCRVAMDACRYGTKGIYCVPCGVEQEPEEDRMESVMDSVAEGTELMKTLAYILKSSMLELQTLGTLEVALNSMTQYATNLGQVEVFHQQLNAMLELFGEYERIAKNTASYYVITGDETCHGVLKQFALDLAVSLIKLGQAVSTSNGQYGREISVEDLSKRPMKGIIGFQATVLFKDYFKKIDCPKYNFWFDNPMFFDEMFEGLDDHYYFLCQDGEYARYITRHFGVKNSLHFPPAGVDVGMSSNEERPYNLVFIGACNRVDESKMADPFHRMYYEYMIAHPKYTFEQGLETLLMQRKINMSEEDFLKLLWSLQNTCRNVVYYYRTRAVEALLKAGIKVEVFGDTWDRYEGEAKENLIRHEAVSVEESLRIWGQAKIGLNVMTWHKDGMTERIANICLSGAVCLTDETAYLKQHFDNGEDIALFDLEHLKQLPELVRELLESEERRSSIAKKAYEKAAKEHIWDQRAKELLRIQ